MPLLAQKAIVLSKEPWLAVLQLLLPHHVMKAPVQGMGLSCSPAPAWLFTFILLQGAYSLFLFPRLACPKEHNCARSGRFSWLFCKGTATLKALRKKATKTKTKPQCPQAFCRLEGFMRLGITTATSSSTLGLTFGVSNKNLLQVFRSIRDVYVCSIASSIDDIS